MKIAELKGRPRSVVDMILCGYGTADIERMLVMSKTKVHNTRRRAFGLLGIKTDMQLLAMQVLEARDAIANALPPRHRHLMVALNFVEELAP